jgi:hypothetical protein
MKMFAIEWRPSRGRSPYFLHWMGRVLAQCMSFFLLAALLMLTQPAAFNLGGNNDNNHVLEVSAAESSSDWRTERIIVVVAMICRNEEVNFKSNLALWARDVEYFLFLMDERSTDNSPATINAILDGIAQYTIVRNQFEGFGQARTRSMQEAYHHYPSATHVIVADPDWRPDMSTFRLDMFRAPPEIEVFRFTVYDRNKMTNRQMDWILRNKPTNKMRYHLHEVLDIGLYNYTTIPFVAHEIEQPGTWHSAVGHVNSFSTKRYLFDLDLLDKDLQVYGHDPHTHYYLGITNCAVVEKLDLKNPPVNMDTKRYIDACIKYLTLRLESTYDNEFVEERWGAMFQLGLAYENFLVCS